MRRDTKAYAHVMSAPRKGPKQRARGVIDTLPSGTLRVRVYAGIDPLNGRQVYLTETVPDGPDAWDAAEAVRVRMVNEINERRNPRTKATVNQLMDRYLELLDVDVTTRRGYEGYINNHVRPLLGPLPVGKLDGETLDSFYSVLRTCREHCGGRNEHTCRPLASSSIRQIHWCLSGALKRAVRWRWISVNPLDQAEPPKAVVPDPKPPTPEQAAVIVNEAFKDLGWGMLVWLAMTTGARRGELCAMQWNLLDLDNAVLWIRSSIAQDGAKTWEKSTKTHQQRRIALDAETVALLRVYRAHCEEEASRVGVKIVRDGRVFSPSVDHSTWIKPGTVSQRYRRMCAQKPLEWDMNIHQLRHYSATELIAAGVDVRTVAGRLGHGGGGATTLRVYSAWVAEADQKAAGVITGRMPKAPIDTDSRGVSKSTIAPDDNSQYRKIAADLRGAIASGVLKIGDRLPNSVELKHRYGVSQNTAFRALELLKQEGLVIGKRAVVADLNAQQPVADVVSLQDKRNAK